MAVKFAGKFDFLSPVWYRIGHDLEILGKNDINHQWLSQMKEAKKDLPRRSQAAKILPRFTADVDESSISELMSSETKTAKVIDAIIGEVKFSLALNSLNLYRSCLLITNKSTYIQDDELRRRGPRFRILSTSSFQFRGILFVHQEAGDVPPFSEEAIYSCDSCMVPSLLLSLSVHPVTHRFSLQPLIEYQGARNFETRDYIELYHAVDYFHMMTYDYHNAGSLG